MGHCLLLLLQPLLFDNVIIRNTDAYFQLLFLSHTQQLSSLSSAVSPFERRPLMPVFQHYVTQREVPPPQCRSYSNVPQCRSHWLNVIAALIGRVRLRRPRHTWVRQVETVAGVFADTAWDTVPSTAADGGRYDPSWFRVADLMRFLITGQEPAFASNLLSSSLSLPKCNSNNE